MMNGDASWAGIAIGDKRCNLDSKALKSGPALILSVAAVLK